MLTTTVLRASANSDIVLTDAERDVVLAMRDARTNPRLTVIVLQYLGEAWRMYQTTTCKHMK